MKKYLLLILKMHKDLFNNLKIHKNENLILISSKKE